MKQNETIQPGKTLMLLREEKHPGWYGYGLLAMDSPYGQLHVEIDEAKLIASAFQTVAMGLTFVNDHIYCPLYAPLVPSFVLAYTPAIQMPFRKIMVYVTNPVEDAFGVPTTPMTVSVFAAGYWLVDDLEEFKKSVRELHAGVS